MPTRPGACRAPGVHRRTSGPTRPRGRRLEESITLESHEATDGVGWADELEQTANIALVMKGGEIVKDIRGA